MKIDWSLVVTLLIFAVAYKALDKFVLNKAFDSFEESFDGE